MKSTQKNKLVLLSFILITACQNASPADTAAPVQSISLTSNTLTICLGDEPDSLYLYKAKEKSAVLIMQAIFDGPIDNINGQPVPVILESLPNLEDNSAQFFSVAVNPGDTVVDIFGNITNLRAGVEVFPSRCRDAACAVTYDGESPLEMDQLTANFQIKPGIIWSDGQPLTAADSIFSFEIASHAATPIDHFYTERTGSYTATDNLTIQWTGLPGWIIDQFEHFFFTPLPAHAWGNYSAEDLLELDVSNRKPLSWGPYMINEWAPGGSIKLVKNPYYFRSAEGLPRFDTLIFRITKEAGNTTLANLKFDREPFSHLDYGIGEFEDEIEQYGCDLTTTTADMRDQMTVFNFLLNYYKDPAIQIFRSAETDTKFLLFNLDPESSASPQQSAAVRKAVSQCIDRSRIVQVLSNNLFYSPELIVLGSPDPLDAPSDYLYYDPEQARKSLVEAGWLDHDNNDGTPRISTHIDGIGESRELVMTFLVEKGSESENAGNMIKSMLADCGIGINTIIQPKELICDSAFEHSLFRGQFDMAMLAWTSPIKNPCLLFAGEQIPDHARGELGTNFSRFSSQRVDEICAEFTHQMPTAKLQILMAELQEIVNSELPLIPIYSYSALLTAQKNFCVNGLNATYANELAGIEDFRVSADCP